MAHCYETYQLRTQKLVTVPLRGLCLACCALAPTMESLLKNVCNYLHQITKIILHFQSKKTVAVAQLTNQSNTQNFLHRIPQRYILSRPYLSTFCNRYVIEPSSPSYTASTGLWSPLETYIPQLSLRLLIKADVVMMNTFDPIKYDQRTKHSELAQK